MEERLAYVPIKTERWNTWVDPWVEPEGWGFAWVVSYENYRWQRRSIIAYGIDELACYAHALKLLNRLRKRADKRRST